MDAWGFLLGVCGIVVIIGLLSLDVGMMRPPPRDDWECQYCRHRNEFESEHCVKCGAPES